MCSKKILNDKFELYNDKNESNKETDQIIFF